MAIALEYPADVAAAVEGVEKFLRKEVWPLHEKHADILHDDTRKYGRNGLMTDDVLDLVRRVRMASADAGYFAMCIPEEMGGGGMGFLAYFAAWERIFHLSGSKYWLAHYVISHWVRGPSPVLLGLTDELRRAVLPKLMSGEMTTCFGLSEPGAGSDAAGIKTAATPDGDGWRLNGSKIWTSNSPHADYAMVFAVTDPEKGRAGAGISAFLVPTSSEGFRVERVIKMWGSIGGDEAVLHFDDVRIEPHQLVGTLNAGFATALLGTSLGRLYNCARAVGLSRWSLEMAFDYAKTRQAFGKPISDYQGVTFPLAESAMQVQAAHLMSLNVAQLLDRGLPARRDLAMAKAFATEVGVRAVDRAIQTHGAMGMTNELYLTDAYVILRKINIADGTNEILRRAIVKEMLQGDIAL